MPPSRSDTRRSEAGDVDAKITKEITTALERKALRDNSRDLLVTYNRIQARFSKRKNCLSFYILLFSEMRYGGIEGLAVKIRSAVFVRTWNVDLAKDCVKSASELMTGAGVIGALILSVTVPLLLSDIKAHESVYRRFPDHVAGLEVTYKVALMICVSIAITTVAIGARRYHKLNNWMPTLPSQIYYLQMKGQALLASLIVNMFFSFGVTIVFAVGLLQGPWIGFVALCLMIAGVSLYYWDDADKVGCLEHLIDILDEKDKNNNYLFMQPLPEKQEQPPPEIQEVKRKDTE